MGKLTLFFDECAARAAAIEKVAASLTPETRANARKAAMKERYKRMIEDAAKAARESTPGPWWLGEFKDGLEAYGMAKFMEGVKVGRRIERELAGESDG